MIPFGFAAQSRRAKWRELVLLGLLVATSAGCSNGGLPPPTKSPGHAGQPAAGDANAAGNGGNGGVVTQGGAGGTLGTAASAGTNLGGAPTLAGRGGGAGATSVPAAWTCGYSTYGDGECDCGCGAPDKDCTDDALEHCAVCNGFGSCNLAACPGRIDPSDVTHCLAPPEGWTCTPSLYGDGASCDCGCGIEDADCRDTSAASCDNCAAEGSCARGPCPSAVAADDNTRCEIPARWTCDASTYGDGVCNCGCGVVDVDCPDATAASCEVCDQSSCWPLHCNEVEPDDNAHCASPPPSWNCSARLYHDGTRCDCGCGAIDPDCESAGVEACEKCDAPGACSAQACPSIIDAKNNGVCDPPPPPAGWTCPPNAYADGLECDCGCGVPDLDCRNGDFDTCVRCIVCGGHGVCEGTIEPTDTTQCAPPPTAWICSAAAWRDAICDCGCGVPDVYCQGIEASYVCGNYPVEGCSAGNKSHIDPNHNEFCSVTIPGDWTCDRSYYDDGFCDCGCGTVDPDCASNTVTDCEKCDDEGSCSTAECPGTIVADDTAHCSN
jgi:hypothetical protein